MEKKLNSKYYVPLILLIVSFLILMLCSKNSFLYVFNDWVDGNAFFTMGKGMFNGKVPYKDLFEQKGPLLYFIYGIGYLLSNDTFTGVFILEVISLTVFSYFVYLTANRFIKSIYACFTSIITSSIIAGSTAFVQGGSAEEFCLPFLAISIYTLFELKYDYKLDQKYLYINGFIAGCVALIKFNLLGFWFVWMAMYFFKLVYSKTIKGAFISCIRFLVGMIIPVLISLIYFGMNNAIKDFFNVYIVFNVTAYSTDLSLKQRVINMFLAFFQQFTTNRTVALLLLISFLYLVKHKEHGDRWYNITLLLSFVLLLVGVYSGGLPYLYYFLCFECYIIFAFIYIFCVLDRYMNYHKFNIFLSCSVLFVSGYFLLKSPNLDSIKLSKDTYAQFVFKDIIQHSKSRTLLNYDNLDGGFYTTCDIVPNVRYFMRQNVGYDRYPYILDGQNNAIKNKEIEFVIIREYNANRGYRQFIPFLNLNYEEIMHKNQKYEGMDFTYYLYRVKRG